MTDKMDENSLSAIDIARFVFSILIIAFHFPPLYGTTKTLAVIDFVFLRYVERLAVPFFFLCSGFFLFREQRWIGNDYKRETHYIFRIIRLYFVWSIIYLPLSIYSFQFDDFGISHAILVYIRNFFFSGSYFHLWYLNALAFAVCLILILQRNKLSPEKVLLIAGILYLIGLLAQSWFGIIKPLELATPRLWLWLKRVKRLIGTSRNGLFEGFLYVGIGMYISVKHPTIKRNLIRLCVTISLAVLLLEIVSLRALNWSLETDMYLFQVPAVFFLFLILKDVRIKSKPIHKKLRKMSGLMYYVHPLLGFLIGVFIEMFSVEPTEIPAVYFALIVFSSILVSACVLILSKRKSLNIIKLLYI